jgi:hypothetical protein
LYTSIVPAAALCNGQQSQSEMIRFSSCLAFLRNPDRTARYLHFLTSSALRPIAVPDLPHLEPPSRQALDRRVNAGTVLLEYGAGGSSLYFARKGATVLSVDSSRRWTQAINRLFAAEQLTKSHVMRADIGPTLKWGVPLDEAPTEGNKRRWWAYLSSVWEEADRRNHNPQIILIDGRFRVACAAYSIREILRRRLNATIFFDDYLGRPEYHEVERLADIVGMHGRMAEMKVKAGISDELATQFVERYLHRHR